MTPEDALLAEIARPGSTRDSIVRFYRRCIHQCRVEHVQFVDWPTVNRAILARYTPSGLNYIKFHAWKSAASDAEPEGT